MTKNRIKPDTRAFINWKSQTQDTFEFSVLVCHAVPTLKRNIRLYEKGTITELVKPDHYGSAGDLTEEQKHRQNNQLKERSIGYRSKLSKYILISNFSFFEAYIIDVLNEMINFHGGQVGFVAMCKMRGNSQIEQDSPEIEKHRKKLRIPKNGGGTGHRIEATLALKNTGYRFPSDLLSNYGAKMLLQKIANLSAKDIPTLLVDGLHMNLSESLVLDFNNARDIRNKIAHGENIALTIEQVTNISKTLREITLSVDQHLLKYYFISEKYIK